jgi:inner membrane protein
MSPVTHFLTGWLLANATALNRRERACVTVSAIIPDIDGIGIIPELMSRGTSHPVYWFTQYHHALHSLLFALVVGIGTYFAAGRRWLVAGLAVLAFHIHLLEDVVGSRGPDGFDWPIPYFFPFSTRGAWSWRGQWALNAWQNVVLTCVLLAGTFWLARLRGYSPLGLLSERVDGGFVKALRDRFPRPTSI